MQDENFTRRRNDNRHENWCHFRTSERLYRRSKSEYTLEIIRLSNYEHQFVDGRPFENYNDDMKLLVSKFDQADGFIIASPIFQGSIPGVLKNTFDFLTSEINAL